MRSLLIYCHSFINVMHINVYTFKQAACLTLWLVYTVMLCYFLLLYICSCLGNVNAMLFYNGSKQISKPQICALSQLCPIYSFTNFPALELALPLANDSYQLRLIPAFSQPPQICKLLFMSVADHIQSQLPTSACMSSPIRARSVSFLGSWPLRATALGFDLLKKDCCATQEYSWDFLLLLFFFFNTVQMNQYSGTSVRWMKISCLPWRLLSMPNKQARTHTINQTMNHV